MASLGAVENYIIKISYRRISPYMLQKILYLSEAFYTVIVSKSKDDLKSLFDEEVSFEAQSTGPWIRSTHNKYRKYGYRYIEELDTTEAEKLTEDEKLVVEFAWKVFGGIQVKRLEEILCDETPYKNARNEVPLGYSCSNKIRLRDMFDFYSQRLTVAIQEDAE